MFLLQSHQKNHTHGLQNFNMALFMVRRWADKFCLHCNISIYIRHICIKPILWSRMVSLFHHTSPWTHRCLQFSPSAHRNGRVFRRSVQTACCYWILNRGKSSSNWNSQTNASRLWWSVCWCEYSKTLGKAVQRWRIGASRFERQNTKDGFKKLVHPKRPWGPPSLLYNRYRLFLGWKWPGRGVDHPLPI